MEIYDLKLAVLLLPLAMPLVAAVPDGYVVKVESSTVYLDWGKASGVQAGDQFKAYRAGEPLKHPVTGEVLGQTEIDLGQGAIADVQEKFSTGKLLETKGDIKAGDRTRRVEPVTPEGRVGGSASAGSSPTLRPSDTPTLAIVPKELWRSEPMKQQAMGLALGDIDGDGKKELVVAFRDEIDVYKWDGAKMAPMTVFKSRGFTNFLSVETGDLDNIGHDKIFASLFLEGVRRSRTVVLEYRDGALREAARLDGFVRAFDHADGKRELMWQDTSLARELRIKQPAPLTKTAKGYREGKPLRLSRSLNDDQLFGYAWGDWDNDGAEDFAMLQGGERLRLFFKDAKWSSNESYGGSKADFSWENEQVGTVYPRLVDLKAASGKMQLLVPHNIPYTPIKFTHLKIYKSAEIVDLAWNGLEMTPVWTLPVSGALADFGIGDAQQSGTPQLWVAAVGAGDKTVLLSYQLP